MTVYCFIEYLIIANFNLTKLKKICNSSVSYISVNEQNNCFLPINIDALFTHPFFNLQK